MQWMIYLITTKNVFSSRKRGVWNISVLVLPILFVFMCGQYSTAQTVGDISFIKDSIPPSGYGNAATFGGSLIDVNMDGLDDFTMTNYSGRDHIYLNTNAGFSKAHTSVSDQLYPSSGQTWGDFDNDSDPDLFVATQGTTNHLFQNDFGGNFTELATGGHIEEILLSSHASWVDMNNDGYLDLFIANTASFAKGPGMNNSLYKNNGDGSFKKVTKGEIVNDLQNTMCGNWADFDNDGDQDLFSLNMGGDNSLYINNGDGTFLKSTDTTITNNTAFSIACSWVDYNNDANLDLYVGNGGFRKDKNYLFKNNGNGTFSKITEGDIVNLNLETWNTLWGDLDNDGDLDMIEQTLPKGMVFHLNNGEGTFSTDTMKPGIDGMCSGAFSDLDNDGDLDFLVVDAAVKRGSSIFYNQGNTNNWLQVSYKGITGSGIGARVKIKANINGENVWQIREIAGNTAFRSQNSLRAHFGLGNATIIDSLVFYLPSTGFEVIKTNVKVNQHITLVEPLPNGFLLPRFVFDQTEGKETLEVKFTDFSMADPANPIVKWQWDFNNDGEIDSEEQNPTYTFTANEDIKFTVKLSISNGLETKSYIAHEVITLYKSNFTNLAVGKKVSASSIESVATVPENVVDGLSGTRWASQFEDPQWIVIDFEEITTIGGIYLEWETAYASEYKVYVSTDSLIWTEMYATPNGLGGITRLAFEPIEVRYVMMYGTKRATSYGYSLYEFGAFDRMPFGTIVKPGERIKLTALSGFTNNTKSEFVEAEK